MRDTNLVSALSSTVPNPFKGLLPNSSNLNGSTVALQQLLIPFPQYPLGSGTSNGLQEVGNGGGSSYYESLDVRVQKRLTNGLTLINNFIYESLLQRTAYLNDSDPAPVESVSADSRPLREIMAAVYSLPIGRGRALNLQSRWSNALLGGWVLNGVLTFQSGPPLAWTTNILYTGGALNLRCPPTKRHGFQYERFRYRLQRPAGG